MSYLKLAIAAILAIVILGLAATAFWYRGNALAARAEAAQTRANLATVEAANLESQAALARLKADKAASDKLAADLAEQVRVSNQALLDATTERRNLENENDDIRKFLAQRIPDALRVRNVPEGPAGHH